jgi:hypothetical protein
VPEKTGYEHTPEFWNAYLATSVGLHLNGEQPDEELRKDYELCLKSPAVNDTLRALLPPCPKPPRKRR